LLSTEHLPIERSVFECLRVSAELNQTFAGGALSNVRSCFIQLDETFRMNRHVQQDVRDCASTAGLTIVIA
jgi:hypothetical protein